MQLGHQGLIILWLTNGTLPVETFKAGHWWPYLYHIYNVEGL